MLRPDQTDPKCWSNIVQHCWVQHVGSDEQLVGWWWSIKRIQHVGPKSSNTVGCNMLDPLNTLLDDDGQSNWSNMLVQHHPTLLGATCWIRWTPFWMKIVDQTDPTCWSNIIQHCWMHHVGSVEHLVGWWLSIKWIQHVGPISSNTVGCNMMIVDQTDPTCWSNIVQHLLDDDGRSNGCNMLVQPHSTLLDATCWIHLNTLFDDDYRSWRSLIA